MEELTENNQESRTDDSGLADAYKRARFWLIVNITLFVVALMVLVAVFMMVMNTTGGLEVDISKSGGDAEVQDKGADESAHKEQTRRLLDGVWGKTGAQDALLAGIIIDNHVDARPPSGLSEARLVYEAEVEGGITRYMAVFSSDQEIPRIGPIRSARPYFLDLASGLPALFVHVGGSPAALAQIAAEGIPNMNQFYQGEYFWREDSRPRPHNVYTSMSLINDYLSEKGIEEYRDINAWKFKEDKDASERPQNAQAIKIDYTFDKHGVKWLYNYSDNEYLRYLDNSAHKDASGGLLKAKNVVIQTIQGKVLDEKLRLELKDVGGGEAVVCQDGECRQADWKKDSKKERTKFIYENGKEAEFNAGVTWIELVRPHIDISY